MDLTGNVGVFRTKRSDDTVPKPLESKLEARRACLVEPNAKDLGFHGRSSLLGG